jgi:hypothetical protein
VDYLAGKGREKATYIYQGIPGDTVPWENLKIRSPSSSQERISRKSTAERKTEPWKMKRSGACMMR